MSKQNGELVGIVTKFAESGWDLIGVPSRVWLELAEAGESSNHT